MHDFIKNNQQQFTSSRFMPLPTKIIKHVSDAAGVPVSAGDKSCRSSLNHFNLVFLVQLVLTPDCAAVIQVGTNHGEKSLGLGFFAGLS